MAKGETDYEIWDLDDYVIGDPKKVRPMYSCDVRANVILKLARMKWPKNGLTIIPVKRK